MRKSPANIFCLLMAVLGLVSCGPTILYKPSPYIDPLPEAPPKDGKTGQDPLAEKQWNLKKVGVNDALYASGVLNGNYNVRVAIMSTGIDYNHKDLVGQVVVNNNEISQKAAGDIVGGNKVDDDKNGLVDDIVGYDVVDGDGLAFDRHGAGTATAGIIGAKTCNAEGISGLIKEVGLYPIRYINENGQSNAAFLVSGLDVALKAKPDVLFIQNTQIQVGSRRDPELAKVELSAIKEALRKLKEAKIPIVIGAGDDMSLFGANQIDQVFLSFDNVVVVTSSDEKDKKAFIANQGFQTVLTAAPGEAILSTGLKNTYQTVGGSAYAAAHVTAAIALAKSKLGARFDIQKIVQALLSVEGSDQVPDLTTAVRGGNRLNIGKFLTALN